MTSVEISVLYQPTVFTSPSFKRPLRNYKQTAETCNNTHFYFIFVNYRICVICEFSVLLKSKVNFNTYDFLTKTFTKSQKAAKALTFKCQCVCIFSHVHHLFKHNIVNVDIVEETSYHVTCVVAK